MKNLLDSLETCMENKNWEAALFIALALPDICAKAEGKKQNNKMKHAGKRRGKKKGADGVGPRYREWCETYFLPIHTSGEDARKWNLSPQEIYKLRCSYFHEGGQGTKEQEGDRRLEQIQFIKPGNQIPREDGGEGLKIIVQENDFGRPDSCLIEDYSPNAEIHLDKAYDGPDKTMYIDVESFCREMAQAVREWLRQKGSRPEVQARLSKILSVKQPEETKFFSPAPTPPPPDSTRGPSPPPPSDPPSGKTPTP